MTTTVPSVARLLRPLSLLVLLASPLGAQPAPEPESTVVLNEFVVTEAQASGYRATNSISGLRINTPIKDIPQSISVVTGEFLRDRSTLEMESAFEYTAGLQRAEFNGRIRSRGFVSSLLLDGLAGPLVTDTSYVERVEVVRGPIAALYGTTSPGGVINQISKRPSFNASGNVRVMVGNHDLYRGEVGATGPLGDRVAYRVDLAYENSETFRDLEQKESRFVTPSLLWRPTDRTEVTLRFNWFDYDFQAPASVLAINSALTEYLPVARGFNKKEPIAYRDVDGYRANWEVVHRFNDRWSLRHTGSYGSVDTSDVNLTGFAVRPGTSLIARQWRLTEEEGDFQVLTQTDLTGRFETGGFSHRALFGFSLEPDLGARSSRLFYTAPIADLDVFNPVYGAQPGPRTLSTDTFVEGTQVLGLYVFDQISFPGDRVDLVLGMRYDDYETVQGNALTGGRVELSGDATSPYAGLVFKVTPELSLYALASETFIPNLDRNPDGTPFEPTEGTGMEVGAKVELLGGRVSLNATGFEVKQSNVLVNDFTRPGFRIQSGEDTSTGFEFEGFFSPTENWQIIASYTYLDARKTSDTVAANVGLEVPDSPKHRVTVWNKYDFTQGALEGLGVGVGFMHVGERKAFPQNNNFLRNPSYERVDAAVYYRTQLAGRPARLAVNVENLFDKEYIAYFAEPGWARRVMVSLDLQF